MAKPGVMIYFDIIPALQGLPKDSVGELLMALLVYAKDGTEPTFSNPSLNFAWPFIKSSADRDSVAYEKKQLRSEWLSYCKKCKRDGIEPLDFESWCEHNDHDNERSENVALRSVNATIPTTAPATISTPATDSNTTTDTTTVSNPAPQKKQKNQTPTLDEVIEYAESRGRVDLAEKFFDYYDADDWYDQSGNKVRNWKQKFISWEQRTPKPETKNGVTLKHDGYDDLRALLASSV